METVSMPTRTLESKSKTSQPDTVSTHANKHKGEITKTRTDTECKGDHYTAFRHSNRDQNIDVNVFGHEC